LCCWSSDVCSSDLTDDGGRLADAIAAHLPLKLEQKQEILEMGAVAKRLEHLLGLLEGEVDILQAEKGTPGPDCSKAKSTPCRAKSASAVASSARWRRASASIT